MFNQKKILAAVIILLWLSCLNFMLDIPNVALLETQDGFDSAADWLSLAILIFVGITSGCLMWKGSKASPYFLIFSIAGYLIWRFVSDGAFYSDFIYTIQRGDISTEIRILWSNSKSILIAAYYFNFFVPLVLLVIFFKSKSKSETIDKVPSSN